MIREGKVPEYVTNTSEGMVAYTTAERAREKQRRKGTKQFMQDHVQRKSTQGTVGKLKAWLLEKVVGKKMLKVRD
jgi:hypothetical protein